MYETVPGLTVIEKDKLLHCLIMLYWRVFYTYVCCSNQNVVQGIHIDILKNMITAQNKDLLMIKRTNDSLNELNQELVKKYTLLLRIHCDGLKCLNIEKIKVPDLECGGTGIFDDINEYLVTHMDDSSYDETQEEQNETNSIRTPASNGKLVQLRSFKHQFQKLHLKSLKLKSLKRQFDYLEPTKHQFSQHQFEVANLITDSCAF